MSLPTDIINQPSAVVLDTDVISFLFRRHPFANRYRLHVIGRRRELEEFLAGYAIEYPDRETCRTYGQFTAAARRSGFVVPETDAWHVATALRLGIPLVTHNARHFQGVPGLMLITEPGP